MPLFKSDLTERNAPIGFRYAAKRAMVGDRYKILTEKIDAGKFQLYDIVNDPNEAEELSLKEPTIFEKLKKQLLDWDASVDSSFQGKDYAEGLVTPSDPEPINWYDAPQYQPYLEPWKNRWEYAGFLKRAKK
jgi:hypothetical protein